MSSLQISLAVAGGVVLAALVAHGAWVARRNAPKQAQPDTQPEPGAGSPAAAAQRREPGKNPGSMP